MSTNTGLFSERSTRLAVAHRQHARMLGVGNAFRKMNDTLADLLLRVHEHLHLQCRMIFNGKASRSHAGTTETGV